MKPDLFIPSAHYHQQWSGAVAIIAPEQIPTVDFYICARLDESNIGTVFRFESLQFDAKADTLPVGTFLIVVRHTSAAWLRFIKANQQRWSGVAYLMDDDIPGALVCRDIPFDYALWTSGRYWLAKNGLKQVCDRLWLSTKALSERYASRGASLLQPAYVGRIRPAAPIGNRKWAYHGTRIHIRELKWLVPIVAAVQEALPRAEFEVFGDAKVARLFSGVPRVKVMAPLPWVDYLDYCYTTNIAVGVAPMLAGPFNAVRSCSKAFDIARCGAVGVFSSCEPYAALESCLGATTLDNDQEQWVNAIVNLLQNDALRIEQYEQFLLWIKAQSNHEDLSTLISASVTQ